MINNSDNYEKISKSERTQMCAFLEKIVGQ